MSRSEFIAGSKARFDRFNVELSTGKLQRSGLNVPIQSKPFEVLRLLLIADGNVVSRDQLLILRFQFLADCGVILRGGGRGAHENHS